jgi:hypothetical protein
VILLINWSEPSRVLATYGAQLSSTPRPYYYHAPPPNSARTTPHLLHRQINHYKRYVPPTNISLSFAYYERNLR